MSDPVVVGFISLGCAKNLVDSEVMLARLTEGGAAVTADIQQADVVVINTCGFLAAARAEAHDAIRDAVAAKQTGRCRRVVVVGCLVQRDRERLRQAEPGIDVLLGVNERDQVAEVALASVPPDEPTIGDDVCIPMPADVARLRLTPPAYAYVRIGEGCNQHCTFCTIPAIRGPMRSKPPEVVLDEARELLADGVAELDLIAQDTTAYGRDLDDRRGLADLLRQLDRLDGVDWIRLMYAYPRGFDDAVIDALAGCDRVVKYVDLPLQHINDRLLRQMGRRVTRRDVETLLEKLRQRMRGIALRTTLIVGFPGETDAEFNELLRFVRETRFDALGVFAYSREPGTPAARLPNQHPEHVKRERLDAIMQTQQAIAFDRAERRIGQRLRLLVERADRNGRLISRHAGQAPEVDGVVKVVDPPEHSGPFIEAECVARDGYDLIARPCAGILKSKAQGPMA